MTLSAHSVPVAMLGAVTAYVGLYHLWLHVRRWSLVDLYFSLTCLTMTAFDVFCVLGYNSSSVAETIPWQRGQGAALMLMAPFLVLFVDAYADWTPPRWFRWLLTIFPLGFLVIVLEHRGWTITREPSVKHVHSVFGDIVYHEARIGPLLELLSLVIPLVAAHFIWVMFKARDSGGAHGDRASTFDLTPRLDTPERPRLPLLVAAGFLLLGFAHDTLVAEEWIDNFYLSEYSFSGVVFLMSWSLSNEVVAATATKQTLRAAQARITTVLDAIQDAVITADLSGNVLHLNPAAEKMLAVPLPLALGRPVTSFVELTAPDTQTLVADPVDYAVGRAANPYGRLPRLVTTDGSDRRVDLGGAPLVDDQGHVRGAVVVLRDLTLQHNALESLQHAKQMEATGQLAGGLAHDLNNLLTPILSYVDLVQRQTPSGTKASLFLEHALEAAQRAAGLTRQLLALSRKQVLDVQVIGLNDFVTNVAPILGRLVPETIEVAVDLDDSVGQVRIDPGQFEQVLLNLVSNARDAMPEGGRVVVSTQRLGDSVVCIGVTDHGTGIPKEVIERVFEPFFTTKPRGKGTGLGLASVRGIVEQHGGTVYVDSEVGAGTTIDVLLPVYVGEGPKTKSRSSKWTEVARGTERVLVVEDDAAVRTLIQDALGQLGYDVRTADGMSQAIAIAAAEPIDLLVTDVVLPGTDGPKVYRAVREIRDVPCLYVTGHADDRLGERGFLSSDTEVLRKPFKVSELADKVRSVLEHARHPPSSRG